MNKEKFWQDLTLPARRGCWNCKHYLPQRHSIYDGKTGQVIGLKATNCRSHEKRQCSGSSPESILGHIEDSGKVYLALWEWDGKNE